MGFLNICLDFFRLFENILVFDAHWHQYSFANALLQASSSINCSSPTSWPRFTLRSNSSLVPPIIGIVPIDNPCFLNFDQDFKDKVLAAPVCQLVVDGSGICDVLQHLDFARINVTKG